MRKRISTNLNRTNSTNTCNFLLKVDIQSGKIIDNMARLELFRWMIEKREVSNRNKSRKTG